MVRPAFLFTSHVLMATVAEPSGVSVAFLLHQAPREEGVAHHELHLGLTRLSHAWAVRRWASLALSRL